MKKIFLFVGVMAAAAVSGGAAAWMVTRSAEQQIAYVEREVERTPALGSQFTSYEADRYPDLTYAAENAVKAVVNIEAVQEVAVRENWDPFLEFFGVPQGSRRGDARTQERRAGGSGVIISEDGYIVTNNHVVDEATKLRVTLNDGRTFDARIIGKDPATDVALIKIDAEKLPTIPFGNSDSLRLGEWVLAIGSPFDLRSTITAGIVSAKARTLGVIPNEFRIESFIQTDAAVNPGNSGGALVNVHGELVGINTVIKSSTGSYIGYSFAVPETIVKKVVTDLKEFGVEQRADGHHVPSGRSGLRGRDGQGARHRRGGRRLCSQCGRRRRGFGGRHPQGRRDRVDRRREDHRRLGPSGADRTPPTQ